MSSTSERLVVELLTIGAIQVHFLSFPFLSFTPPEPMAAWFHGQFNDASLHPYRGQRRRCQSKADGSAALAGAPTSCLGAIIR